MSTTQSIIEPALRERFANRPVEQLTDDFSETYKRIKKASPQAINSRGGFYVVQTTNNRSHEYSDGTTGEGGDFPSSGRARMRKLTVPAVITRSTANVTSSVLAQDKGENHALALNAASLMDQQIQNMINSHALTQNISVWGDGSGELARVSGTSGTTVTCNNSGNLFGTQLLEPEMIVDVYSFDLATFRGSIIISTVNRGNMTFVASAALPAGTTSSDRIILKNSKNNLYRGLKYLGANSGSFQGESDRTINPMLSGINIDTSGRTLSAAWLRRQISAQRFKRNGKKSKAEFFMSSQADAYEATAYAMKLQTGMAADTGYDPDKATFGGVKVNWEIHVQRDHVFNVDWSYMDRFELKPYELERTNGNYLHRVNAQSGRGHSAQFNIYAEGMGNFGTNNPAALVAIAYGFSTSGLELGNNT